MRQRSSAVYIRAVFLHHDLRQFSRSSGAPGLSRMALLWRQLFHTGKPNFGAWMITR